MILESTTQIVTSIAGSGKKKMKNSDWYGTRTQVLQYTKQKATQSLTALVRFIQASVGLARLSPLEESEFF